MRIVLEVLMLLAALLAGGLAISHWRRAGEPVLNRLGLKWEKRGPVDFLVGFFIAAVAMILIYLVAVSVGELRSRTGGNAAAALVPFALMALGALKEEILWRSFLLSGLIIALRGRWIMALVISSLIFGLIHLGNPSASWLSVLGNALGGLMYGLAFLRTGALWLPVGLHLGWNFVQGPVLGFPVSGYNEGGLLRIVDPGMALLTGGSYGPEGGLIGIAGRFIVLGAVLTWTLKASQTESARALRSTSPRSLGPSAR